MYLFWSNTFCPDGEPATRFVPGVQIGVAVPEGCQNVLRTEVSEVPRSAVHVVVPPGSAPPSRTE
jgi:hypothetical protein